MSGGSFDYLYCRPLGEAVESSNFDRMADALAEYPTVNVPLWSFAASCPRSAR